MPSWRSRGRRHRLTGASRRTCRRLSRASPGQWWRSRSCVTCGSPARVADARLHCSSASHLPGRQQPGAELPRAAGGGRLDAPARRGCRGPPGGAGGRRRGQRGARTRHAREPPVPRPPAVRFWEEGDRCPVGVVLRFPLSAALCLVDRPRRGHLRHRPGRASPRRHAADPGPDRDRSAHHDVLAVQRVEYGDQLSLAAGPLRSEPDARRGHPRVGGRAAAAARSVLGRVAVPGAADRQRPSPVRGLVTPGRAGLSGGRLPCCGPGAGGPARPIPRGGS